MEHCCDYIEQALNDPTVYFDYQPECRRYYINTESKLIIHQVYFCPTAAFYKAEGDENGTVLEIDEIISLLKGQSDESPKVSLDELLELQPRQINLGAE